MVRKNPTKEHGPKPANGRGIYKQTKKPPSDCGGCPSERERVDEKYYGRKNRNPNSR